MPSTEGGGVLQSDNSSCILIKILQFLQSDFPKVPFGDCVSMLGLDVRHWMGGGGGGAYTIGKTKGGTQVILELCQEVICKFGWKSLCTELVRTIQIRKMFFLSNEFSSKTERVETNNITPTQPKAPKECQYGMGTHGYGYWYGNRPV
jgi:hypothetical protein